MVLQSTSSSHQTYKWSYIWGNDVFSTSKTYCCLICHRQVHPSSQWLWRSVSQNKRKFFCWLLLNDRLSTRALLCRKHLHLPSYHCVLCFLAVEENLAHLFFHCPFSITCWGILHIVVPNMSDTFQVFESFKDQLQLPFFMDVIITMCWDIWTWRNDKIFRGIDNFVPRCKTIFCKEFAQVILRAKKTLQPHLSS